MKTELYEPVIDPEKLIKVLGLITVELVDVGSACHVRGLSG